MKTPKEIIGKDLFGADILKDEILRERFIEPPFTILDSRGGDWQKRRRKWLDLGIKSELGRSHYNIGKVAKYEKGVRQTGLITESDISIFDPVLCELIYKWFCPLGGLILDPFAGGSVRGIVAKHLGYLYDGIELRPDQVESNKTQAEHINWIAGDSRIVVPQLEAYYDLVFTCPPYFDLEVYSDLPEDLSNMDDLSFVESYSEIIAACCAKLLDNSFAVFVVGNSRDKRGFYKDLMYVTKTAFYRAGLNLYNDAVLVNSVASASMRANGNMRTRKLVKVHQNVLIFYKGDPKKIVEKRFGY